MTYRPNNLTMKVTQVAIRPTEQSNAAGRPALTPELLAASGARYSRNNEGLESILAKIDPNNLDKSVDGIFKMIDYGHQSIADMVPVALFIDGISMWLAYYLWAISPTAGGQESSTRYIAFDESALIDADTLGIPEPDRAAWHATMTEAFAATQSALEFWEAQFENDPSIARIPAELLADTSDKAKRQIARMRRNFGFDRARYFLPTACRTNVMMIMSARAWVQVCQQLLSHNLPESRHCGTQIRSELELSAPRMLRHAVKKEYFIQGLEREFAQLVRFVQEDNSVYLRGQSSETDHPATPFLETQTPSAVNGSALAADLEFHANRYAHFGTDIRRTLVRFGWDAVAFGEIRDLNRHRTGTKHCPLVPRGFYSAADQIPNDVDGTALGTLAETGRRASLACWERLQQAEPTAIYWTLLGTQFPFEHSTTADKFLYEAELRTGTGAHYRYAQHLHDALALWYERFPETRGRVLEGSAEPE